MVKVMQVELQGWEWCCFPFYHFGGGLSGLCLFESQETTQGFVRWVYSPASSLLSLDKCIDIGKDEVGSRIFAFFDS